MQKRPTVAAQQGYSPAMTATELARQWMECFEKKDAQRLVALYAESARHTSPKLRALRPESGGTITGRAELFKWWSGAFARLPDLRYVERTITASDSRVVLEYLRFAMGDPDMPVAEVLEIGADGLITASRVYHG
jgi:hypothetical protein